MLAAIGMGAASVAMLGGLLVLYMTRPRFVHVSVSAHRYLKSLEIEDQETRLHWRTPLLTVPFWVQFLALTGLVVAMASLLWHSTASNDDAIGVALYVDTSDSMRTLQSGASAMSLATEAVNDIVEHLESLDHEVCYRLHTFGLAVSDHGSMLDPSQVRQWSQSLAPGPTGTNLAALLHHQPQPAPSCSAMHRIVVTDVPAPDNVAEQELSTIWIDIGGPVPNNSVGTPLADINPMTGRVRQIAIPIDVHDERPADLIVTLPDGEAKTLCQADSCDERVTFVPELAGSHEFRLAETGAYDGDDRLRIVIPEAAETLKVAWLADDRRLLDLFGWEDNPSEAVIAVMDLDQNSELPAIVLSQALQDGSGKIDGFVEGHPLLEDVNLDAAEAASWSGFDYKQLPENARPVLIGDNAQVWVAASDTRVYVPSLGYANSKSYNLSLLLFLNGVRHVLKQGSGALISERLRATKDVVLVQVEDEGSPTRLENKPYGDYRRIRELALPVIESAETSSTDTQDIQPDSGWWRYLIILALIIVFLDRLLTTTVGRRYA